MLGRAFPAVAPEVERGLDGLGARRVLGVVPGGAPLGIHLVHVALLGSAAERRGVRRRCCGWAVSTRRWAVSTPADRTDGWSPGSSRWNFVCLARGGDGPVASGERRTPRRGGLSSQAPPRRQISTKFLRMVKPA